VRGASTLAPPRRAPTLASARLLCLSGPCAVSLPRFTVVGAPTRRRSPRSMRVPSSRAISGESPPPIRVRSPTRRRLLSSPSRCPATPGPTQSRCPSHRGIIKCTWLGALSFRGAATFIRQHCLQAATSSTSSPSSCKLGPLKTPSNHCNVTRILLCNSIQLIYASNEIFFNQLFTLTAIIHIIMNNLRRPHKQVHALGDSCFYNY
jgi:hypothetical protein